MSDTYLFSPGVVFVYGMIIGSFLNVCIYRIPRGTSIVLPASRCPRCGSEIKPYDNLPLLSYILLRGRCRRCKSRISIRYPVVELLAGLLAVGMQRVYGISVDFFAYYVLSALLIVIAFIDGDHQVIPDRLTLPGIVLGLCVSPFMGSTTVLESGLGLFIGGGLLFLIGLLGGLVFRKESMGGGDVKMAAMVGAFIGWRGILLSLFIAFVAAAIGGVVVFKASSKHAEGRFPFGPFISLGALISILWGDAILGFYVETFW